MKKTLGTTLALCVLAGCVPPGIAGADGKAHFATDTVCPDCPYLSAFARGGRYSVAVNIEDDCDRSAPWEVTASGVIEDFESGEIESGWWYCTRTVTFSGPRAGGFTLEVHTAGGTPIDRIALDVVEPDELLVRRRTGSSWDQLDPERIVAPQGGSFALATLARRSHRPLILDSSQVTWSIEGPAVEEVPWYGGTPPGESLRGTPVLVAISLGESIVQARLDGVTGELPVEVRPLEDIEDRSRWCEHAIERCDGVDNDCDGSIDETGDAGCRLEHAVDACVDGRCVFLECQAGYGDCDGWPGCERSLPFDPTSCGACGIACAETEVCSFSSCVPAS